MSVVSNSCEPDVFKRLNSIPTFSVVCASCTGILAPSEMLVQLAQGFWTPPKCLCNLHRRFGPLRNARATCTGVLDPSEMLVQLAQRFWTPPECSCNLHRRFWTPPKCSCNLHRGFGPLRNARATCTEVLDPSEMLVQLAQEVLLFQKCETKDCNNEVQKSCRTIKHQCPQSVVSDF